MATRCSTPGSAAIALCGATATGTSRTRSSSSWTSASCAQTRWARCGGLNVPPSRPTSATLGPDLARALDQVLDRAQLAQPDRPAGVELLGRVADLGAHAELAPVGEAGGGVDVDAGGVDPQLEGARGGGAAGHDRLGMAGAVAVDVLDRLLGGVDDLDREHEREELLGEVLLRGRDRIVEQ